MNAAEGAEQWFCKECRRVVRFFSAGRSLGRRRPANIRLSPGVPRRLRPNPRQTYFVILSVSEESFSLANQRPRTDYAEQGGERQTKCSQESFWARLQMFRCAQHDGCSGSSQGGERQTKCSQESVCRRYGFFVALLLRMTNYFLIVNCEFCILNCSQLRSRLGCAKLAATRLGKRELLFCVRFAKKRIAESGFQPCEPKPRPAEARKTRPAGFGTRTFDVPLLNPGTDCGSCNTANCKTEKTAIIALKNKRYL